ncbi:MAG: hypothetical protein LBU36_02375, partial [Clostridiales bacterium]|nr:hypothetical protein [Clostridiales bacterium]
TIIRDPAEQAAIISEIEAHKNDGKRLEPAERPDVITYPPSTYTSLDASNGYRDTVSYTSRNTDAYAGPYKLSSTNQSGQNLDRLDGYSNVGNITNVIFYVWDMNEDMEEEPGYLPFKYVTPGGGATVPFFTWEVRRTSGGSDFYMDTRQVIA